MNSTSLLFLLFSLAVLLTPPRTEADPIQPKVLILTTFEIGADTGDRPGGLLAVESAYRVGAPVVHQLVQHWDRYATELPK